MTTRRTLICGLGALLPAAPATPAGFDEDFSNGMGEWWTEGGERVWVEDGRLQVKADPASKTAEGTVATVWRRGLQPADFRLELDARVIASATNVNNINLFLNYSDPTGAPLESTRDSRRSAAYGLYHKLNGYIITFLNDVESGETRARIRIRRNPGFELLAETFAFECRQGVTYHLEIEKRGGGIRFSVQGRELLRASDPRPWGEGYFGLRTFRTWLWWDNIRLRPVTRG